MGRHAGFFSVLLLLLAVAGLSSGALTTPPADHSAVLPALAISSRAAGEVSKRSMDRIDFPVHQTVFVRPGELLILGSLDLQAGGHTVELDWIPSKSSVEENGIDSNTTGTDSSIFEVVGQLVSMTSETASVADHPDRRAVDSTSRGTASPRRAFLVPRFCDEGTMLTAMNLALVRENPDVAVYAAPEMSVNPEIISLAEEISDIVQSCGLPMVHEWIGPIADLDASGRLTLVLAALDHRTQTPGLAVYGCVREQDFLGCAETMPGGDIVYLSPALPTGDARTGLIVHELTHAAILSRIVQFRVQNPMATAPPGWLNEGLAHLVERRTCRWPAGFSDRLQSFQAAPQLAPVMCRPESTPADRRRGSCRAATTLFLESWCSHPAAVRQILDEWSLSGTREAASARLRKQLPVWWRQCAGQVQPSVRLPAEGATQLRLHVAGTAFATMGNLKSSGQLEIRSAAAARLQVLKQIVETPGPAPLPLQNRLDGVDPDESQSRL